MSNHGKKIRHSSSYHKRRYVNRCSKVEFQLIRSERNGKCSRTCHVERVLGGSTRVRVLFAPLSATCLQWTEKTAGDVLLRGGGHVVAVVAGAKPGRKHRRHETRVTDRKYSMQENCRL